ncbi:MAG: hypothetical protein HRU00_14165 [Myxococcales bacterium]|nr:hypothetical protein [Myxococcales bacterium]
MALSPQTRIALSLFAQLTPNGDEGGGKIAELDFDVVWASGTGTSQADDMYQDSRTLVASANEDIDLQTITNGNGVAMASAEVVAIAIETPQTNAGTIRLRDSATNPWISFLSSSGATDDAQLDFPPGATMVLAAPLDGSYAVAAGNKTLNFINLDGSNSNVYKLTLITRSA